MPKRPDTKGFDSDQIDYLTSHAQRFHGPSDWSKEVSMHLNKAMGLHRQLDPTTEWVPPQTSDDVQGQQQMQQTNALDNLSESGVPDTTPVKVPKTAIPSKTPDWSDLGG